MSTGRKKYSFSNRSNPEFFTTLKERVNEYFESNKIDRHGDHQIIIKSVLMFLLYLVPYILLFTSLAENTLVFIGCWVAMAFGAVGLGVNVMHDANHGSFSKNKRLNAIMGRCLNLIGGNARTWKLQHNVLHHTYTNIDGMDQDIDVPGILRFSPHQERRWFHRFQFIYAWFLYGLQTFARTIVTDFANAYKYKKQGLVRNKTEFRRLMTSVIGWKTFYWIYALALPLIFSPAPFWLVLIGFAVMHFIAGLLMAIIFQSAHVMPDCEFPLPNEKGSMANNWAVHQLQTTTNFSPRSRIFSWFVGGLNYQIEHHLFANICHTHYRDISKIVSSTAKEFGVQYNMQKSFFRAIWEHGRMLKRLGTA